MCTTFYSLLLEHHLKGDYKTMCTKKIITLSTVIWILTFPLYGFTTTVTQAVNTAINTLPDMRIDIATRDANIQTIKEARSAYYPTLDLNAGIGRAHTVNAFAASVDNPSITDLTRREFGLNLTENVFDGFNTVFEVQRTTLQTLGSDYKIFGTANDVSLNVIEQFLNVILQHKLVALSVDNLNIHKSLTSMISGRVHSGISPESEFSQSNTRVNLAESNLITQTSNLEDAQTKYKRYVGATATNLQMPTTPRFPAIPRSQREALDIALQRHPILRSANAEVVAAYAQHNESKFTNYPKLDLVLSADMNHNIAGIEGPFDNYMAMARLSYNIFAGGKYIAKQKETAYQTQNALEIRNRTILQIREAIQLAWTAMVNQHKRMLTLDIYRHDAAKTLASYNEEYKLGKRTLLDLLDTQNEVYQSNVSYQQAKFDELFARYRLLNAMGTLDNYLRVTVSQMVIPPRTCCFHHTKPPIEVVQPVDRQFPPVVADSFFPWAAVHR